MAIAQGLRAEEDYDLAENYVWALEKRPLRTTKITKNRRITRNYQSIINENKNSRIYM